MSWGGMTKAETISVKVLALRRGILGDKHPDTVRSMAELAATCRYAWAV